MTDRIDVREHPQDGRVGLGLTIVGAAIWTAITLAGGGIDLGGLPPGDGATGLMVALTVSAAAAVAALWWARRERWGAPALLAVGGLGGLAAWSLASMAWAAAPDLAWLAGNRLVLATAVAIVAVVVTPHLPAAADALAVTVSYAATVVMVAALATRVLPELFAPLADAPRLAAPIGHANTLALIAVFAIPGALVLAARRGQLAVASLIATLAFTVLAMSGSRSGVLALIATGAIGIWGSPDRRLALRSLACGVIGAALPVAVALASPALTREPTLADPGERRGIGLLLGLAVLVGAAIAVTGAPLVTPVTDRLAAILAQPRGGRVALIGAAVVVGAGVAISAVAGRDAGPGALRFFSSSDNNRGKWWDQAWQGFLDAPVAGNGAGGFLLTHILHRDAAIDTLLARQPHQIGLELASEVGLIGVVLAVVAFAGVAWGAVRGGRTIAPALGIVVAMVLQAQLDVPNNSASVLIVVAAAVGVVVASPTRTGGEPRPMRLVAAALGSIALLGCAAGGIVTWSAARMAGTAYLDPAVAAANAESAADRNPVSIRALLILARARSAQGDRAAAVAAADRATDRQPDNPFSWECLATVSEGADRDGALARLSELDPARDPSVPPGCRPAY